MNLRVVLVALFVCFALCAVADPPPITEAERAASELVLDHLARGPRAFVERLSDDSPFAPLDEGARLQEVSARVGPNRGANWELRTVARDYAQHGAAFAVTFPSGLEDVVLLDLNKTQAGWRLRDIRTLAEVTPETIGPSALQGPSAPAGPGGAGVLISALLALAALLAIIAAPLRHRLRAVSSALLLAALASLAGGFGTWIDPTWSFLKGRGNRTHAARRYLPMQALVPVRNALATGRPARTSADAGVIEKDIATLWIAMAASGTMTPEQTVAELQGVRHLHRAPMYQLLIGRAEGARGDEEKAKSAYAAIRSNRPEHDAFLFEELMLADPKAWRAPPTRDPFVAYGRVFAALLQDDVAVIRAFQDAWRQQPVSRRSLLSQGIMGLLVSDPGLALLVNLNRPREVTVSAADFARAPVALPPEAQATVCGTFLRVQLADAVFEAPGAASMAPRSAQIVSAERLEDEQTTAALALVEELDSPALNSAGLRRTVESVVDVLARANRWDAVLQVTGAVQPGTRGLPLALFRHRAAALTRLGRKEDVRLLASGAGVRQPAEGQVDAHTLLVLAELLARTGAWDDAIALVREAGQTKDAPVVTATLERFDLRRQLASAPAQVTTAHFAIHTTQDVPVTVTERVGQLLEAELARITTALGAAELKRTSVNITKWDEFSGTLTRSDSILGFYDGDITVPFGDVGRFRDEVVSILTHELTHAVVAQESANRAPRWFQEGLARRMELVERKDNIFQLHPNQDFIAMTLLDVALQNSLDPAARAEAYTQAATIIYFLEDRYGREVIPKLIRAFRDGTDPDAAVKTTLQVADLAALDEEFRKWGVTHPSPFLDDTPWPYMQYMSLGIDPSIRNSIQWSRRPPASQP